MTTAVEPVNFLKAFREYLAKKGYKITPQRLQLLEAIQSFEEHFTAEHLLERARSIDPSISRASVYRTIPLLTESNMVREIDVGKEYKYYSRVSQSNTFQTQIVCENCDKIFEVDAPFLEWYGKTVAEKFGMKVLTQRLQIIAQCPNSACLTHRASNS